MARDNSNDIVWFLAGMALGVTAGLLFAPQSGAATRTQIRNAARRGGERLKEQTEHVYAQGRDLFERGKALAEEASELFERGRNLVDS